eukprot:7134519-Prymnesium_polylepis.1
MQNAPPSRSRGSVIAPGRAGGPVFAMAACSPKSEAERLASTLSRWPRESGCGRMRPERPGVMWGKHWRPRGEGCRINALDLSATF